MIRVLQILSDTNIGGAGRSLLNYLRFADLTRFAPIVAIPEGSLMQPPLEETGTPVYAVKGMADRSFHPDDVRTLRKLIRQVKPDLIHTHGALSGRIAARLEHLPVVYTKHCAFPPSGLLATPPGRLANRVLNGMLADGVLAMGPAAKENLMVSGIPAQSIRVLFNGVTPIPVPTAEQRAAARCAYGFREEDFVLGILARVERYKGHGIVLEALSQLLEQGRQVRLLVAGEGPYLDELRKEAAALPDGAVVFAGFVTDVERALWAMDVQVNASYESEASSLSLLEGMSMGLPAVVSDCGGNPSHISDGENGLVFPSRDSAALARCVARLMDEPDTLRHMHEGALAVFDRRFTGERFARSMEDAYLDILKGAK